MEGARNKLADQEEEVNITATRIDALKLQVAGCTGNGDTTSPTGSTASAFSTGLQLTEAFERAINEMRIRPGVVTEPTEANPDDCQVKRLRQSVSVELTPPMIELWNLFRNTVRTHGIGQPNPDLQDDGATRGHPDVLMRVSGE